MIGYVIQPGHIGAPEPIEDGSLADLQRIVGGYIEVVELDDHTVLVINSEGKFASPPEVNVMATDIAAGRLFPGDFIAGTAIVLGQRGEDFCDPDVWAARHGVVLDESYDPEADQ